MGSFAFIGDDGCTVGTGRTTITLSGSALTNPVTHRTHAAALTAGDVADGEVHRWTVYKSDGNYSTIVGTLNDGTPDTISSITWEDEVGTISATDSVAVILIGDIAASTRTAAEKTAPVDADVVGVIDSAASNVLKKVTWANIKATLKTYFDTLYGAITTHYRVTDSTDVTIATTEAGANAIGSSFSMDIPTKGTIGFATTSLIVDATSAGSNIAPRFGLLIGATVYPIIYESPGGSPAYSGLLARTVIFSGFTEYLTKPGAASAAGAPGPGVTEYMISQDSLPTGSQTVTLVVFENTGVSGGVIKGTTRQTDIVIEVMDLSGV